MAGKKKIAILGGGVGAMTAAFELTQSPNWQDNFEITVYQLGWRLGGKGASGRNLDCEARIEEHGLHIWFGFYENAFELIRLAYEEVNGLGLTPGSPFTDFTKAFTKQTVASMFDQQGKDGNSIWSFIFPTTNEIPGTNLEQQQIRTPWDEALALLHWLLRVWEQAAQTGAVGESRPSLLQRILSWLRNLVGLGERALAKPLHMAVEHAEKMSRDPLQHTDQDRERLLQILDQASRMVGGLVSDLVEHTTTLRRLFILVDAVAATVRGLIEDGVLTGGYERINQYDLQAWLKRHGCVNPDLATRPAYDACFAYQNGDFKKLRMEAGSALRGAIRTVTNYRGAVLWRMNAGMGDTIFSPLYLLLKQRGVKFEFFHRVENLGLSNDKAGIDTITFDVQATVKQSVLAAKGGYDPLVTVRGIPCWPNHPLYDQLDQGEALKAVDIESAWTPWNSGVPKKTLRRGVDFDDVVLGISIGALPFICKELIDASQPWRDMIKNVGTVQTQAVQLWLNKTAADLGYSNQIPIALKPIVPDDHAVFSGYVEPFDTYADMFQVLDKETWPPSAGVRQVAYFCNVLPDAATIPAPFTDPGFPAREHQRVKDFALNFFRTHMKTIWPAGVDAKGGLDWSVLVDTGNRSGEARFDAQFCRANIDPSERYVLSLPGTAVYRLDPAKSGFENLVLAGDWTFNFLNVGCVEAAVVSGRLASRALCGFPKNIMWAFGAELKPQ
jgi:uncharacterized protein with NAD-binding domain and iron-sulfur cluster